MKIETDENGTLTFKEVYNSIILESDDGDKIAICMRDGGFEINYNKTWYEAKEGNQIHTRGLKDIEVDAEEIPHSPLGS